MNIETVAYIMGAAWCIIAFLYIWVNKKQGVSYGEDHMNIAILIVVITSGALLKCLSVMVGLTHF